MSAAAGQKIGQFNRKKLHFCNKLCFIRSIAFLSFCSVFVKLAKQKLCKIDIKIYQSIYQSLMSFMADDKTEIYEKYYLCFGYSISQNLKL